MKFYRVAAALATVVIAQKSVAAPEFVTPTTATSSPTTRKSTPSMASPVPSPSWSEPPFSRRVHAAFPLHDRA
jgi:hypothetical protein